MKRYFLKYALDSIQLYHPEYDTVKMDEMRYGLEGFYLTITKSIIIFIMAILFHVFWEMLFMLLIFNILRKTGFGLHASKSWICLVSSTSIFILLPILSHHIIIPFYGKLILSLIALLLIYWYAPADTIKHPLIYADRRKKYKIITTINCFILSCGLLLTPNQVISNLMLFGIYNEIILILPITYKLFHLSYNNYLTYVKQS